MNLWRYSIRHILGIWQFLQLYMHLHERYPLSFADSRGFLLYFCYIHSVYRVYLLPSQPILSTFKFLWSDYCLQVPLLLLWFPLSLAREKTFSNCSFQVGTTCKRYRNKVGMRHLTMEQWHKEKTGLALTAWPYMHSTLCTGRGWRCQTKECIRWNASD